MRSLMMLCALGASTMATARPQTPDTQKAVPPAKANETGKGNEAGKALGDIVTTPLQDTNLKTKRIPEVLERARSGPYDMAGLRNCAAISRDITELSSVLGSDFDVVDDSRPNRGRQAANVGKAVVQSLIPFRGVIREVSGAAGAQRGWDAAVDAGIARRGFLRGLARARGCRGTVS